MVAWIIILILLSGLLWAIPEWLERLWMLRKAVVGGREGEREIDAELARDATSKPSGAIRSKTESRRAVLRHERIGEDLSHVEVRWHNGEIVIEGQDLGPSVQAFYGYHELEWTLRIKESDREKLMQALNSPPDLLSELERRFSGENAAQWNSS